MFRSLAGALVLHERVKTTDAKAKELRRVVERLITKARRLGDVAETEGADLDPVDRARKLHVRRLLQKFLPRFAVEREDSEEIVDLHDKVISTLGPRYADRPGGYTRTMKLGPRAGDGAPMAIIELIPEEAPPEPAKKGTKAVVQAAPKAARGKKATAKAEAKPTKAKSSKKKADEDGD